MATDKQKNEMANIIKKYNIGVIGDPYIYPNIPDKKKTKIMQNVDGGLFSEELIAVYDFSITGNCKDGLFFTSSGFYLKETDDSGYSFFQKFQYINFTDIESVSTTAIKLNDLNKWMLWDNGIKNGKQMQEMLLELRGYVSAHNDLAFTLRPSGRIEEAKLTEAQQKKCRAIIHTASVAAGAVGTGLAQIPASDNAVIVPIQISMITLLGAVFGVHITEGVAKGLIGGFVGTIVGRAASQFLLGWIPVLGNAINTATAAGLTEAIGWFSAKNLAAREQAEKVKWSIEGQKKGYIFASLEYENKLVMQANFFAEQKERVEKQRDAYNDLMREMSEYINKLENEKNLSGGDRESLTNVKNAYNKINNLG